jgi:hypothetical protein
MKTRPINEEEKENLRQAVMHHGLRRVIACVAEIGREVAYDGDSETLKAVMEPIPLNEKPHFTH